MQTTVSNSINLSPMQKEFIRNANKRYNLKVGAVRSGKSYVDTAFVIPYRIRERQGKKGLNLILGVSKESIERNVLEPMREIYTDRLIGNIKSSTNQAIICGEPVYCLGAEKASQVAKIQGMSVKYCYGDEVAKWNRDVFKMLQSRLDKPYSCFDGALNPESPSHWLKKEFLDNGKIDAYIQHYRIFDNPFLPRKFVENLCKEYEGTVYYGRYIEGEWTQAEGLIFPHYMDAVDKCPYELNINTFKNIKDFAISIDYGTLNAFACILWCKYQGIWWGWKGYYYSGRNTGMQLTDSEYADAVCELVEPIFAIQDKLYKAYKIQDKGRITTYVDPSAASFITELDRRKMFRVQKANNDVNDGIRDVNMAIRHNLIKIDSSLVEWIDEAGGYVWDDKASEDKPVKVNDHYMDSTRYFVRTSGIVNKIKEKYVKEEEQALSIF